MCGNFLSTYLGVKFDHTKFLEETAVSLCNIQPDHNVLEIGFGNGHGIKSAVDSLRGGSGMVYGVETTTCTKATNHLKFEIAAGKAQLFLCSLDKFPFDYNLFDRVFHVNSFFNWEELDETLNETYRVMKPGSIMVTCFDTDQLKIFKKDNFHFHKHGKCTPDKYIEALKKHGFVNIKQEQREIEASDDHYRAIFATTRIRK